MTAVISIETKDRRNAYTYHVVIEKYADNGNLAETVKPAAFNAKGDAVAFVQTLSERITNNLGHDVIERI